MDNSSQSDILRSQRFFLFSGPQSLPMLCLDTLKPSCDANFNLSIEYKDGDVYESNIPRYVKLTSPVQYLLNNSVAATKRNLDYMDYFIAKTDMFVKSMRSQKMIGQPEGRSKETEDNLFKSLTFDDMKLVAQKLINSVHKGDKESIVSRVSLQVFEILKRIIELRIQCNEKVKKVYEQGNMDNRIFDKEIQMIADNNALMEFHLGALMQQTSKYQLLSFMGKVNEYFDSMINYVSKGSIVVYQPSIVNFNRLINPISMAIFFNLFLELIRQLEIKRIKKYDVELNEECIFPYSAVTSVFVQNIVFINLDGEDSMHTLDLFRCVSEHAMYVSFPKNIHNSNTTSKQISEPCANMANYFIPNEWSQAKLTQKVQECIRNTEDLHLSSHTEQSLKSLKAKVRTQLLQKQENIRSLYNQMYNKIRPDGSKHEVNKNVFVFPLCNEALNTAHSMDSDKSVIACHYESSFVYRCIMDVVMRRIQEFAPTLIVVSYNGKIHLQNYHFEEIIKALAVEVDCRVMFYPNMTQGYESLVSEGRQSPSITSQGESGSRPNLENKQKEHYKGVNTSPIAKSQYLNVSENEDVFEKIQIFHTVVEGKNNLSPIPCPNPDIEKFRNIQIQPYLAEIMKVMSSSNEPLKQLSSNYNKLARTHQLLSNTTKYQIYEGSFSANTFVKKLALRLNQLLLSQMEEQSLYSSQIQYLKNKYMKSLELVLNTYCQQLYVQELSQKQRKVVYLNIPGDQFSPLSRYDSLHIVRFVTNKDGVQVEVNPTENVQILYSNQSRKEFKKQNTLVYVMNHLFNKQEWKNYYGILKLNNNKSNNEQINVQKIELFELTLNEEERLDWFQVYTDWNHHQTAQLSMLYWPVKLDLISHHLSKLSKIDRKHKSPTVSQLFVYQLHSNPNIILSQTQHQSHHLTKCNCVHFQDQQDIQFYFFGGYQYQLYHLSSSSTIIKLTVNKGSGKYEFRSLVYQQPVIPLFSEFEVHKEPEDKVFLVGGYGSPYKSQYHAYSSYFYEIDFRRLDFNDTPNSNLKHIIRHNILTINQKIKQKIIQKMKEKGDFTTQQNDQIAYEPINIKSPLKLRDNIREYSFTSKTKNSYRISAEPKSCLLQNSYLVRNYIHYFIQQKSQKKSKKEVKGSKRLAKSFLEYSVVDEQYYTYSQEYQLFLDTVHQSTHQTIIKNVGIPQQGAGILVTLHNSKSETPQQFDCLFIPSQGWKETRRLKHHELFTEESYDVILDVKSVCFNYKRICILFNHPRVTDGRWVIAVANIDEGSINRRTRQIRFQQCSILHEDVFPLQSQLHLNILDNMKVLITSRDASRVFSRQHGSRDYLPIKTIIDQPGSILMTCTHNNYLILVFFKPFQSNHLHLKIQVISTDQSLPFTISKQHYVTIVTEMNDNVVTIDSVDDLASQEDSQLELNISFIIQNPQHQPIQYFEVNVPSHIPFKKPSFIDD